jgi:hypothetical protein
MLKLVAVLVRANTTEMVHGLISSLFVVWVRQLVLALARSGTHQHKII